MFDDSEGSREIVSPGTGHASDIGFALWTVSSTQLPKPEPPRGIAPDRVTGSHHEDVIAHYILGGDLLDGAVGQAPGVRRPEYRKAAQGPLIAVLLDDADHGIAGCRQARDSGLPVTGHEKRREVRVEDGREQRLLVGPEKSAGGTHTDGAGMVWRRSALSRDANCGEDCRGGGSHVS
jgi:hypothetical protein